MRKMLPWSLAFVLTLALPFVADHAVSAKAAQAKPSAPVNLNTASQSDLEALPGVGPATAKKIIAGRPYASVADLAKAGVPKNTIEKIASMVTVGAASGVPSPQACTGGDCGAGLDTRPDDEHIRDGAAAPRQGHGMGESGEQGLSSGRRPILRQYEEGAVHDGGGRRQGRLSRSQDGREEGEIVTRRQTCVSTVRSASDGSIARASNSRTSDRRI